MILIRHDELWKTVVNDVVMFVNTTHIACHPVALFVNGDFIRDTIYLSALDLLGKRVGTGDYPWIALPNSTGNRGQIWFIKITFWHLRCFALMSAATDSIREKFYIWPFNTALYRNGQTWLSWSLLPLTCTSSSISHSTSFVNHSVSILKSIRKEDSRLTPLYAIPDSDPPFATLNTAMSRNHFVELPISPVNFNNLKS